ncbi:MAG: GTP-binding protein [Anaerolineaceae bacterium]
METNRPENSVTQAISPENMNIVFVGHVDHGKSTIIGRLLADTNSLPKGKLEALQQDCRRRGVPFEYAYLIDALKDERAQSITIDTARIFFKSKVRDYLILDAPGHIEFIKNMVTGASHAEAAVLVIDAQEGVMDNSRRHGYLLSLLGIKQVIVAINKMDLVGYDQAVFEHVKSEYTEFLKTVQIKPACFIPLSGREGEGVVFHSEAMPWYTGPTVLEALDTFEKQKQLTDRPFRLPVQDIYKFSGSGDQRRIIAGSIVSGIIHKGDALVIYPSGKQMHVLDLVAYNRPDISSAESGEAIGLTMQEQVYVQRGEMICLAADPPPHVSSRMRVSLFWIGRESLRPDKTYLLKVGTVKEYVKVEQIHRVIDAASYNKLEAPREVRHHEVAEVTLKANHPIAFDTSDQLPDTSRFVLVDGYEIAGGGIIQEALTDEDSALRNEVYLRNQKWVQGLLTAEQRADRFDQHPALIIITGKKGSGRKHLAAALERSMFEHGNLVYYLGIGSVIYGINADLTNKCNQEEWAEHLRRFAEVCHLLLDTGMILIITAVEFSNADVKTLKALINSEIIETVWLGDEVTTDLTPDIHLKLDESQEEQMQRIKAGIEADGLLNGARNGQLHLEIIRN